MTLVFTLKNGGKKVFMSHDHVVTWNEDSDGIGTMVLLSGGISRAIQETPDEVCNQMDGFFNLFISKTPRKKADK
jgi:hypothetical protein